VFALSWDGFLYALDFATGAEVWRFAWEDQPGASFPAAGSPTIADVDGRRMVVFGAGEHVYSLDAATGAEQWRFAAGTGCRDATTGTFPGLCSFAGERNQVESTPIVHDGVVYVGMDVNDVATGKGGFYAIDAAEGTLRWFWDPESGSVCRPNGPDETGPGDVIRRFDGYHSEADLGLPAGFFASRSGCAHPRTRNGCGNIWSSAALDATRGLLFFGTSNCDTDDDPATSVPPPPMPPYDEALVALRLDGTPAWTWRPREVDNDDLAFGAVPNLFSIDVEGVATEVVGIGGKDGTYYVIDRDGVNERTGVAWNDAGRRALPYWERNVVPGGAIGGIIATAAIDESARRVLFSTAPGDDVVDPQRPTVHALDLDTGAILWQNVGATGLPGDASYAPTSAVPGVMIVGSVITPHLRFYDTATGALVADHPVPAQETFSGVATGAAVVDGTVITGAGIGARSSGGSSPGDFAAMTPSAIVAFCVPGAPGCSMPEIVPHPASITEGDSGTRVLRVPVTTRHRGPSELRVRWTTLPGRAKAPADYVAASGTLVIPRGADEAEVEITVRGDVLDEALDDDFAIRFFDAERAVVAADGPTPDRVRLTIVDDDRRPRLTPVATGVVEGDGETAVLEVPIELSAPSGRRITVDFVTAAGSADGLTDFVPAVGRVTIAAGQTRGVARVLVRGDGVAEAPEWFVVSFRSPRNAVLGGFLGLAFVIVTDDD
jgi:outer membrane protein assembly factor BamB